MAISEEELDRWKRLIPDSIIQRLIAEVRRLQERETQMRGALEGIKRRMEDADARGFAETIEQIIKAALGKEE